MIDPNETTQDDITLDVVDVEQDPSYRDFLAKQPMPSEAEMRAKIEEFWSLEDV